MGMNVNALVARLREARKAVAALPVEVLGDFGKSYNGRIYNCLRNANIATLGELCQFGENRLRREPNLGRKSIEPVKAKLLEMCLRLDP